VTDDISVTFWEAGHILGSAMLDVVVNDNGLQRRIIFSGDIGQWNKPLIHDPSVFREADYVVMESTYGDRDHPEGGDVETQLERVIKATVAAGGNVVIPTFAVERAQELMYYLSHLLQQQRIPRIPVYLDSPMAVDVTEVFRRHRDRFDAETWNRVAAGVRPLTFPGLVLAQTTEQSKAINFVDEPCIIMSTSGMCTAGRIKHHLRHNISRPESTILFVGFQASGTLGRQILDGQPEVRIHGQLFRVRAKIQQVTGFSGHADRSGLLHWASHFAMPPRRVFLTHGEEQASVALAATLKATHHWDVLIPDYESITDLR
jgi:metallo-beta-lactamase family protein